MLVNLSAVKQALGAVVDERYDHTFVNLDTPPFDSVPPTPENLAAQLLAEGRAACAGLRVPLVACHLAESERTAAIAWADGTVEREFTLAFSAARRTCSPHLSDEENTAFFGRAASPAGHGHGYRLRVVLRAPRDAARARRASTPTPTRRSAALHETLDHRNLNLEVPALAGVPMTTECLARFVFTTLAATLPVARVRLHEMPHFFAEYDGERAALGLEDTFSAAHCLRQAALSERGEPGAVRQVLEPERPRAPLHGAGDRGRRRSTSAPARCSTSSSSPPRSPAPWRRGTAATSTSRPRTSASPRAPARTSCGRCGRGCSRA